MKNSRSKSPRLWNEVQPSKLWYQEKNGRMAEFVAQVVRLGPAAWSKARDKVSTSTESVS